MKSLTNLCPVPTIPDRIRKDRNWTTALKPVGNIWTGKLNRDKMMFEYVIKKSERLEVRYVLSKKERVPLPKGHCRRKDCHYSWLIRKENPPEKCPNYGGYEDDKGVKHPKCGSRHWDEFPPDFDPATCECDECLYIYYQLKAEEAEEAQRQLRAVNE